MSTLTTTRNYGDSTILYASDFDAIILSIETFVNTTKLNDDNIQTSGITASTKLATSAVTTAKLAANAVTTAKLADGAITSTKITDANVTTDKLASETVSTANINDLAVTSAKLAGSITRDKLATCNYAFGSSSGTVSSSTGSVLICSVTITTTGRPVLIGAMGAGDANCTFGWYTSSGTSPSSTNYFELKRDSTSLQITQPMLGTDGLSFNNVDIPASQICYIDASPGTGSVTYGLYVYNSNASLYTTRIANVKLVAVEIV
jgi:hypothetical protein